MMQFSTLFKVNGENLTSEAEVETRFLTKLFSDLGFQDTEIIPKRKLPSLLLNDGNKKTWKEVDFLLLNRNGAASVVVEAKDPKVNIHNAWGQAASYALSYNRDKQEDKKVRWLLITNGHITSLYKHDSDVPTVTLQLSDFSSGSPPYVSLRSHIKCIDPRLLKSNGLAFTNIAPDELNTLFFKSHDLVWRKEKLNPTDAFFEFCKFIFIKIKLDKIRESTIADNQPSHEVPLTIDWLKAQEKTSPHPVRDVLFSKLHRELEDAINRDKKKRIFDTDETLNLSASTCKDMIEIFQEINLSSIDEDLNGRMFETFLASAIRGKALGQYFTPRPVVDFMTRLGLRGVDVSRPPQVIDACSGTAGFLIEVMAYLMAGLREDTRYTEAEKETICLTICNKQLYGIEANERVARIARINMYLHGDGGSHIFHGDGLDADPCVASDMTSEKSSEVLEHKEKILPETFDLVLSNPPFSMKYDSSNESEARILDQRNNKVARKSAKSNLLFLERYFELMKPNAVMLIVLDDTLLNGKSHVDTRNWLLNNFQILSVHSLPFNAFFKAKANVKTSVLHVRKKASREEKQGHVFMSISNNIGHDNALKDTYQRNNLNDILNMYMEWKRTGVMDDVIKNNHDKNENLECPEQAWVLPPERLVADRLDAFFYSPDLNNVYCDLGKRAEAGEIVLLKGKNLNLRSAIDKKTKDDLNASGEILKYIEIGNVTKFGLIATHISGVFNDLPSRGKYQVRKGDLLLAINNSSRGTVVKVPQEFDGAICTSGFLVITPKDDEDSNMLWYGLRSEYCRKQIYYLAQTASQPELKIEMWKNNFVIPYPKGSTKSTAADEVIKFFNHLDALTKCESPRFD